jgi:hypothetical protein
MSSTRRDHIRKSKQATSLVEQTAEILLSAGCSDDLLTRKREDQIYAISTKSSQPLLLCVCDLAQ